MICKCCDLKDICKTYDFIINTHHADVIVTTCKHNDTSSFLPSNNNNSVNQTNDGRTNNPNYKGQARQDLKELEKQLNPELEKPEPIKVTCPTCEGTTYDDDLMVCNKCSKVVCSNCGTVADGKVLCKECWEKE